MSHLETPRGVYAAVLTPLSADLEPDVGTFVDHCLWLLANGCDGLAPLGTTGEANSLSVAQGKRLIEGLAASDVPMGRCIVGAGSCALADAVDLTKTVMSAGCDNVLLLPPFYYKAPSEDGLFAFFSELVERVGSDRLRLYLYHFPKLSTVPITVELVRRLRDAYGPVIAGLKDSSGEWTNTLGFIEAFPGFGVFSGSEEFLLDNLRAGGVGCISASTNVTAPLAGALYGVWDSGEAAEVQRQLTEARLVLQAYPLQAALKEVLASVTRDREWLNIVPPNQPLGREASLGLMDRLGALPQMKALLSRETWTAAERKSA